MNTRVRHLIFISFVTAFLAAAPLVVLYTAGYRYHFATGQVVQTGALSLSTVPKGARIIIDGEPRSDRTPAVIDNVRAGVHTVRLQRDGYSAWEKRLGVENRETTFVKDLALFLEEPALLEASGIVRAATTDHSGRQMAFFVTEAGWTELWAVDMRTGTRKLLHRLPENATDAYALSWSADGSAVLVDITTRDRTASSVIRLRDGNQTPLGRLARGADGAWWDTVRNDRLFATTPDGVLAIDLDSGRETPLPATVSAAQSADGEFLVAETIDGQTVVSRTQGGHSSILAYLPRGNYRFRQTPREGLVLMEDRARERLVLLDGNGGDRPILLHAPASHWQWEPQGARLLLSDGFDLSVYDPDAHALSTLTRLSQPITGIAWHPGGSAVLYAQSERLAALGLDRRDGHFVTELARGVGFESVAIDPRGKRVSFFGTIDGREGLFVRKLAE